VIGKVSSSDRVLLLVRRSSIKTPDVVLYLKHLLRHVRGKMIVFFDNLRAHRAKAVVRFALAHKARLGIEYFPAYAPELNPAEWLWRHLKYTELANTAPKDVDELHHSLRRALRLVRRRPALCRSFLRGSSLSF